MVWLTAWLYTLVSSFGASVVSWVPTIILAGAGPVALLSFLHYVWAKINNIRNPNKNDRSVNVYDLNNKTQFYAYIDSKYTRSRDINNNSDWDDPVLRAERYKKEKRRWGRVGVHSPYYSWEINDLYESDDFSDEDDD